jgi:hypothetical protein
VWSGYQEAKAVADAIGGGIEEGLVHLAPIMTGKVKTRTLENHKGTAPMVCKLAKGAPPANDYRLLLLPLILVRILRRLFRLEFITSTPC